MEIQENISLKEKNWFKTGGNAKYFSEPESLADFQRVVMFANEKNIETFILGEGANIIISDEGFEGLVINTVKMKKVEDVITDTGEISVSAEAGMKVQELIDFCLDNNIVGLEDFSGIPGTVGGSAYINIHYFDKLLADFVSGGVVIEKASGNKIEVDKNWFGFGYDRSKLMSKEYYLYELKLTLRKASDVETAYAKGRGDEIVRQRHMRYPYKNTCGSFFRNFQEDEVKFETNGKKIINVAYYLDKIGVKGDLREGNAVVSYKHANMIETMEGATSQHVVNLARRMQEIIKAKFGLLPQPECQLIGFKEYPLL